MAFIAAAETHVHVYLPQNSAKDDAQKRFSLMGSSLVFVITVGSGRMVGQNLETVALYNRDPWCRMAERNTWNGFILG